MTTTTLPPKPRDRRPRETLDAPPPTTKLRRPRETLDDPPRRPKRRLHRCRKHRGVTLVTNPGGWQARWTDPATGRSASVLLTRFGLTREDASCRWAIEKKAALGAARRDLDLYGVVKDDTSVRDAVAGFVETKQHEGLRARSVATLRDRFRPFVDWCGGRGLDRLNRLTVADLAAFRDHVLRLPARRSLAGKNAGRGAKILSEDKLGGTTRRSFLASTEYFLRERSSLPSDLIRKTLAVKKVQVDRKPIVFLDSAADIRKTVEAAIRHDGADGNRPVSAALVLTALLAGLRRGEIRRLAWSDVDLDANEGKGVIRLDESTKTKRPRKVGLDICPVLRSLLATMRLRAGLGDGLVFGDAPMAFIQTRLRRDHGAPSKFSWQVLRRTCAAWSCSAPGVFGAASAFMSAKRLGHGVGVSERYYADAISGIDAKHRTLEDAMGVGDLAAKVVGAVGVPGRKRRVS